MTFELTEVQYKSMLSDRMLNVTETARPPVDIWPYVEELVAELIVLPYVSEKKLVEVVYRDEENRFDHILLPTAKKNKFICIVVDLSLKNIKGHYSLNLEKEYGLQ